MKWVERVASAGGELILWVENQMRLTRESDGVPVDLGMVALVSGNSVGCTLAPGREASTVCVSP